MAPPSPMGFSLTPKRIYELSRKTDPRLKFRLEPLGTSGVAAALPYHAVGGSYFKAVARMNSPVILGGFHNFPARVCGGPIVVAGDGPGVLLGWSAGTPPGPGNFPEVAAPAGPKKAPAQTRFLDGRSSAPGRWGGRSFPLFC